MGSDVRTLRKYPDADGNAGKVNVEFRSDGRVLMWPEWGDAFLVTPAFLRKIADVAVAMCASRPNRYRVRWIRTDASTDGYVTVTTGFVTNGPDVWHGSEKEAQELGTKLFSDGYTYEVVSVES
jgi:hypothetical protein